MLAPIGKPVIVRDTTVISRIRQEILSGKSLNPSNFCYIPKKSVSELLGKDAK
jgi:hypothetical protein